MDYDAYIDLLSEQLDVNSFNKEELHIIESCFEKNWDVSIAASLIKTHWQIEDEEDYNSFGDYD